MLYSLVNNKIYGFVTDNMFPDINAKLLVFCFYTLYSNNNI